MISLDHYFGIYANHPDAGPGMYAAAEAMLERVNRLLHMAENQGIPPRTNPKTNSQVSGETNGGFRPQDCPIGAPKSSHKQARAVDVYDPDGQLDDWLNNDILEDYGLYRESPEDTKGWCHLSDKAPPSGRRTFKP